jgi:hypothetical protein
VNVDRENYERDLAQRRKDHLQAVRGGVENDWRPCMHDACQDCVGTGIRRDGSPCMHMMSCPCPRCSPSY